MSSLDLFREGFEGLRQSLEAGRTAHAYLLLGQPRGSAMLLAESFLQLLFCTGKMRPCGQCGACRRIAKHEHPDVVWVEPESKSRRISIDKIRDEVIALLTRKSYEGGWKAAVIVSADRMTEEAANALLKTLEEPPGRSVLLLLTDAVHYLRPTIVSRCQRVWVGDTRTRTEETPPWRASVLELLREGPPRDILTARRHAARLKEVLDAAKARAEKQLEKEWEARSGSQMDGQDASTEVSSEEWDARVAARVLVERAEILRFIQQWKRDVLLAAAGITPDHFHFREEAETICAQAQRMSYAQALRDVQAVQKMAEQLEQHLPAETVFMLGLYSEEK